MFVKKYSPKLLVIAKGNCVSLYYAISLSGEKHDSISFLIFIIYFWSTWYSSIWSNFSDFRIQHDKYNSCRHLCLLAIGFLCKRQYLRPKCALIRSVHTLICERGGFGFFSLYSCLPLVISFQAYLLFGDEEYLYLFQEAYAAAMHYLYNDPW